MRPLRLLPWLLLVALVLFSVAVYDALPPQVPKSVDLSGRVAHTAEKSPASWGLLPFVALLTLLLMESIRRRLPRRPDLFNFPGKDDLRKLPAEFHPPVIARMQRFLDVTGTATMLIMCAVQLLMWHTARGGSSELGTMLLLISAVLITPLLFLVQQGVTNEVEDAKKRWESRRHPLAN